MKIKIVESASTMPPMGKPTPKKRKPKPMPELPKVDRKTHYDKYQKSVRRILLETALYLIGRVIQL